MWQHVNITQDRFPAAERPRAVKGAIAAYATPGSQHVVYQAVDDHIRMLIRDHDRWRQEDLGLHGIKGAALAAYYWAKTNTQHVVFHGSDSRIHMLIYENGRWREEFMATMIRGKSVPQVKGVMAAYVRADSQHVVYPGTDDHIYMLKYEGGWALRDLGLHGTRGAITAYRTANSQHVVFPGGDGHIHMLKYTGTSWKDVSLTNELRPEPLPAVSGAMGSYARVPLSQHVFFHGADNQIHALVYQDDNWRHVVLDNTEVQGGLPTTINGPMAAYITHDTQHVVFRGADDHIHDLRLRIAASSGGFLDDLGDAAGGLVDRFEDAYNAGSEFASSLVPDPIKKAIEKLFNWGNTIGGIFITPLEGLLSPFTSFFGGAIGLMGSIPYVGRGLKWAFEFGMSGAVFVLNMPDVILTFLGIMPTKKMRIGLIIQRSLQGPVADIKDAEEVIRQAIDIFYDQVRVKLLPVKPFHFSDSLEAPYESLSLYYKERVIESDADTLDVCCLACAFGKDLGSVGGKFEVMMTTENFWGNGGRAITWGAPVVAFAVRSFTDDHNGCSLGPLTDYVTVRLEAGDLDESILAHELGHACNLIPHSDERSNLMFRRRTRGHTLNALQRTLVRTSRHVTSW